MVVSPLSIRGELVQYYNGALKLERVHGCPLSLRERARVRGNRFGTPPHPDPLPRFGGEGEKCLVAAF